MKQSIYLTNNNPETLEKLESLGFNICPCCKFEDIKWIHFYYRTLFHEDNPVKEFHGIGNGCENGCFKSSEDCIICSIKDDIKNNNQIYIATNVEDCVNFINKNYE